MLKSKLTLILALALLGALAWGAIEHQRAERYQLAAETAETLSKSLLGTIDSKDEVISKFQIAVKAFADVADAQQKTLDAASKRVQNLKTQLAETRRELQIREAADHEIPECELVLKTDLRVCPGHVSSMLERADSGVQGPASGSTDASAGASGPEADSGLRAPVRSP
jgi:hypothetical protein